jgi:uncharacterized protein (TIGR02246 family)
MNKVWSMVSMLSVLSVLGVSPLCAAPEDEVRAVVERFVAAQNAHDIRAVGELLLDAPHFLWITRGTPIWGHEAALKRFASLYQGTWRLEPDMPALRVMMLGDTSAQVYVPIVFTIGAPGQAAQATRFLMNQVLVKAPGGWRVSSILPIPVPTS